MPPMIRALAVALLLALPLAACNEDGSSTGSDDSTPTGMGRMVATAPMSTEIQSAGAAPEPMAVGQMAGPPMAEGLQPDAAGFLAYTHDRNLVTEAPDSRVAALEKLCREMAGCSVLTVRVDGSRSGYFEARLPKPGVTRLDDYLSSIAENGEIDRQTSAEDLSDQMVDVKQRIALLTTHRDRLQALYQRSDARLEDLITISRELADTQTRLERAQGEFGRLESRIDRDIYRAQLRAPVTEPGLLAPFGNLGEELLFTLVFTLRDALEVLVWIIGMLPALIPLVLLLTLAVRAIRRRRKG
jgi:hypothetical protein